MEIVRSASREPADVDSFGSERFSVLPLTIPPSGDHGAHVSWARLGRDGRIGRHVTPIPQLLVVVQGAAWVSGQDGAETQLDVGDAVVWNAGEEHETRTDDGLTAVIVEAAVLQARRDLVPAG